MKEFTSEVSTALATFNPLKLSAGGGEQIEEFAHKGFALFFPPVPVGRLRHGPGDAPRVILFMEVAHQGGIRETQIAVFAQPAAKFHGGPVPLAGQGGIVGNGEDVLLYRSGRNAARPSRPRTRGYAVDSPGIEAFDPRLQISFDYALVAQVEFKAAATKQQMDGIEPLLGLLIRTTIKRELQLGHGAGFGIGKLMVTSDSLWLRYRKKYQQEITVSRTSF